MKKLLSVLMLFSLAWGAPVLAVSFEENSHYISILPEPDHAKPGDKIEVVEFFMYSCPHCYNFEPTIKAWKKSKAEDIEFVRVPAMFGRHFNLHAQAYYALEAMGEHERVHDQFFAEIHQRRNALKTRDAIESFLEEQGIDLAKFRESWSSFAVAAKVNRASSLLRRYSVRSVPTMVVDARYRSGSGLSHPGMAKLIDHLADKVREERKGE